jgi:hypothetical protein
MNRRGPKDKARPLGLKRMRGRRLATTIGIVTSMSAFSVSALSPPASATAGNLAGTWSSVDLDGSSQTLAIRGAGNPVYSVFLRDDFTSGVCNGPPAKLVGHGVADGDEFFVRGTLVCLHGGNPIPRERVFISFEYDADADALIDGTGVVWERAG